jgi:hypothetical protein
MAVEAGGVARAVHRRAAHIVLLGAAAVLGLAVGALSYRTDLVFCSALAAIVGIRSVGTD